MNTESQYIKELVGAIVGIKDKKVLLEFLKDLLTPGELQEFAIRLQIVKKLLKNKKQREVAKVLGVGVATVTRGSMELKDKKGGFRLVLDKKK